MNFVYLPKSKDISGLLQTWRRLGLAWIIGSSLMSLVACTSESISHVSETSSSEESKTVITGFLKSRSTEEIKPPTGGDWSYKITFLSPEGTMVKPGDHVATLEGERSKKKLRRAKQSLEEEKVKAEQRLAEIDSKVESLEQMILDQENNLLILNSTTNSGDISAEWLVSNRDRFLEGLDLQEQKLALKFNREKLKRKKKLERIIKKSAAKGIESTKMRMAKIEAVIADSKRFTRKAGIVIHKRNAWKRQKPKVGGTAYRGATVIEVVDDKDLFIEAYLEEQYWQNVKPGMRVSIKILGRKETLVKGKIAKISPIVLEVSDWDKSLPKGHAVLEKRAFKVLVVLEETPEEAKPDGEVLITLPNAKDLQAFNFENRTSDNGSTQKAGRKSAKKTENRKPSIPKLKPKSDLKSNDEQKKSADIGIWGEFYAS